MDLLQFSHLKESICSVPANLSSMSRCKKNKPTAPKQICKKKRRSWKMKGDTLLKSLLLNMNIWQTWHPIFPKDVLYSFEKQRHYNHLIFQTQSTIEYQEKVSAKIQSSGDIQCFLPIQITKDRRLLNTYRWNRRPFTDITGDRWSLSFSILLENYLDSTQFERQKLKNPLLEKEAESKENLHGKQKE